MPAAIAVPLIVGGATAGASIAGAKMASNAAKNAAKTQTAAADRSAQLQYDLGNKSLDMQRQMYEQGRADMAPWRNTGQAALGQLSSRMGLGGGMSLGGGAPAGQPPMGGGMTLGGMPQGGYQRPQMVRMVAPTGEQKEVPLAMVSHLEARGARRVQ